jgi:hypothetical protein
MKSPRMRVTVGTLLLGLGGCASSAKPQPDGGCEPPDCHFNPEPQPEPELEPKPAPTADPKLEPKRVNTGPTP